MHHSLLAQIYNPVLPDKLGGGKTGAAVTGGTVAGNIVSSIAGLFFIVAFLFAFVYLLTGGIQWISSGGEKATLESARNKITNAIIGLIIVAAAWAVFALVGDFIGIKLPTIKIPTIIG